MDNNYFWFSVFVLLNTAILFLLTANVSRLRLKFRISVGDGGNNDLIYAMRAHGNAVEQVPGFALIVLALTFLHAAQTLLAVVVIVFTVVRALHAYGMLFKSFPARRIGAGGTYLLQLLGVAALAYQMLVT